MKLKRFMAWLAVCAVLAPSFPVYAESDSQSVDPYGNVIDWDTSGSGNEDAAGEEDSADWMEAPTYSGEEQLEILEKLKENEVPENAGFLHIQCDLEDDWPGYNVTVALYDGSGRRWEVTAYNQNGYEARESVSAGIYKVYRAYVPGDEGGSRYPLVTSESRVVVGKGTSGKVTVQRAVALKEKEEVEIREEKQKVSAERTQSAAFDMAAALLVLIGVLLAVMAGAVGVAKWVNRNPCA